MATQTKPHYRKTVLLGGPKSGKSCLLQQLADPHSQFDPNYTQTIGSQYKTRILARNGATYQFDIWYVEIRPHFVKCR